MFRLRRGLAAAAIAAGMIAAAGQPLAMAATKASPSLTITASSPSKAYKGYVFVYYKFAGYNTATISGTISGATAGEVVSVYGQPFPFKAAPVLLNSTTLNSVSTATPYSFSVTPSVLTKYTVELFASSSATTPLATSAVASVYVMWGGPYPTGAVVCARPVCHQTITVDNVVPASALATEMALHIYPYFGLNLSTTGKPPAPKWLYLNGGKAKVSKVKKISAEEYKYTVSFTFTVGNKGYYWTWSDCTKAAVTKDGIGLPSFHTCGVAKFKPGTYLS